MAASRRDPYLDAGRIWCEKHQEYSLPVDAAWLEDDLLIASYVGCGCADRIWISAPSELIQDIRCDATTTKGRRCRRPIAADGRFCHIHSQAAPESNKKGH